MTRTIDFPDDTLTGKPPGPCNPHELMPQRSGKPHVALAQLQVGFTDTGFDHIDNHFAMTRLSKFCVRSVLQRFVEYNGSHDYSLYDLLIEILHSRMIPLFEVPEIISG